MNWRIFSIAVLIFILASAGIAFGMHHLVQVLDKNGIGPYLADAEGMTLYWFTRDTPGKSVCAGQCADNWPIYFRESVATKGSLKAEDFGTITREDGRKQTTFRGYPLYYFIKDKARGDTAGQGVGGVWFVIDPAAFPPSK